MDATQIRSELEDCKKLHRYLVDVDGQRFWVFGVTEDGLLVRRIVDGVMKPVRTMQFEEVREIEPAKIEPADVDGDGIPAYLTKKQVAELLQISIRSVEMFAKSGRISKPIYLNYSTARWKRSELLASLDALKTQNGGGK